ncbi:hypothetical protein J6590_021134 [Homalodisca vitripennis]|nr:hypothetical protein J6590_021134 [Homalodisca vitripennis]
MILSSRESTTRLFGMTLCHGSDLRPSTDSRHASLVTIMNTRAVISTAATPASVALPPLSSTGANLKLKSCPYSARHVVVVDKSSTDRLNVPFSRSSDGFPIPDTDYSQFVSQF